MKKAFVSILMSAAVSVAFAQNGRERLSFDSDWQFAYGNAASPAKDFGCGTEYFNYFTKAASIHNEGPYSPKFDAAKWGVEWKAVSLPHDWVVDLPFAAEASHSHGYKQVGWKYPETSIGWYRKTFTIPQSDYGRHLWLQFDGIFRNAQVWVNGFYMGHEPSGYATQVYDISEYLNYGGENLVCVRVDASLEEGWFYEGAGIYRHVWLNKCDKLHVEPFGVFVSAEVDEPFDKAVVNAAVTIKSTDVEKYTDVQIRCTLLDAQGNECAEGATDCSQLLPQQTWTGTVAMQQANPRLWSIDDPYMYKMRTTLWHNGKQVDEVLTPFGVRKVEFDADKGFFLNGKSVKLKGANMHQDHAGVGAAIPDGLQVYRLKQLKKYGFNAYRASHNPMTPAMLDACDSLGILVISENRLTGVNDEHIRLLERMIVRDRNHPSIILWSVGNEEWGTEWNAWGERITATMRDYCHRIDPTRKMTVATSSGPTIVVPADVAGYNYILQNPVDEHRANYPQRCALGSEETSGCGTRGVYFEGEDGRMPAINRGKQGPDSLYNCIERGWKFYYERPWLAGLFYWTGFDYRGESNPLVYPATGSSFGILDYCGFPKDEAYYLKSWWTNETVLHLLPHWNLQGHEGETVDVWAYSNCDEVELFVNGKSLGRKAMPKNGHLSWQAVYKPGKLKAVGYKGGKRVMVKEVATTGSASQIQLATSREKDIVVVDMSLLDSKARFVPTACTDLTVTVDGAVQILGVGNGDSAWKAKERPDSPEARTFTVKSFNGHAQVILQTKGAASVTISADGMAAKSVAL